MEKIRCLQAEEIEVRVDQVTEKGVQLLLYKDSRCDKRILDEVFGPFGWKNYYQEIKGNLYCTISIYDGERNQWVDKTDCGVESYSAKEKGEASDAFKRAGFNVGIGRELYTRIFIFIKVPTHKNKNDKYEMVNRYEKFSVDSIVTNTETEKIEKLKIKNSSGEIVFSYGYGKATSEKTTTTPKKSETTTPGEPMITNEQVTKLHAILGKNEKLKTQIYKKLGITSSKELTEKKATALIKQLQSKIDEANYENN